MVGFLTFYFRFAAFMGLFFYVHISLSQNTEQIDVSIESQLEKAHEFHEAQKFREAAHYFNLAGAEYWKKKEYTKAIATYEISLECNEKINNEHGATGILNNLGMIYSDMKRYDLSLTYLQKTLAARRKEKDPFSISSALINVSVVLNIQKKYAESIDLLKEALSLAQEAKDLELMRNCYGMIAEAYKKMGNMDQTVYYFNLYKTFHEMNQSVRERVSEREVERANARSEMLELEKRNNELQLALERQQLKSKQLQLDSAAKELNEIEQLLKSSDSDKKNLLLRANKKDLVIYALEEQDKHQQLVLKKEQSIRNILLMCVGVIIAFCIYFFKNFQEKKRINQELEQALEGSREAIKVKEQFLSVMSHEIRTPLNSVIGYTQILKLENPQEHQIESLNTLEFSSQHLLSLVNDILDFSKIEAGKLVFEQKPFSLQTLLHQLSQSFVIKAKEKSVELMLDPKEMPADYVVGDQVRFSQIFSNLIGNALKFTEKGHVKIGCEKIGEEEGKVSFLFNVEDTGIGIPQEKLETIFESFSQAASETTRKFGGTGLGLTISKKLVELQGGRIWVESEVGKGSAFYVQLPFLTKEHTPEQVQQEPQWANTSSLYGMKVLVVDDNPINRKITQKFLDKWKVESDTAEDGQKGVEAIGSQTYDLVLMDLNMPITDGWEATSIIRNRPEAYFQQLPIIAYSADSSEGLKEKVIAAGMNDLLSKPFDSKNLYQLLQTFSTHTLAPQQNS